MYSVMPHPIPPRQQHCWPDSLSSCSETEEETDSFISTEKAYKLLDTFVKSECSMGVNTVALSYPSSASTAATPDKGYQQVQQLAISPMSIKTETQMSQDEVVRRQDLCCFTGANETMHSHSRSQQPQLQSQHLQASENKNQPEIYRDMFLRQLSHDNHHAGSNPYLSSNPQEWSVDQVNTWVARICRHSHPSQVPCRIDVPGKLFVCLTLGQLLQKLPECGYNVYQQLKSWRMMNVGNHGLGLDYDNAQPLAVSHRQHRGSWTSNESNIPKNSYDCGEPMRYPCYGYPQDSAPPVANNVNIYYSVSQQINVGFPIPGANTHLAPQCPSQPPRLPIQSAQSSFFACNQQVLPSPSDSDISSNSSTIMQDEEDCTEVPYAGGASNYVMSHQQPPPPPSQPAPQTCSQMSPSLTSPYTWNTANSSPGTNASDVLPMSAYNRNNGTVHLWNFIRELLDRPKEYGACVRWVDRAEGTFKIESSNHLARYWGQRKNRTQMNYDKLSRSLRQYYKKGIIQKPEKKQRLVYKFLPPYNQ